MRSAEASSCPRARSDERDPGQMRQDHVAPPWQACADVAALSPAPVSAPHSDRERILRDQAQAVDSRASPLAPEKSTGTTTQADLGSPRKWRGRARDLASRWLSGRLDGRNREKDRSAPA